MISYRLKLHAKAKKDGFLDDKITRHLRLYNRIIDIGNRFYKRYGKILRSRTLSQYIKMKKHDPSWSYMLDGLNSWSVQETIKRRDICLDRFFRYLKKKEKNPHYFPKESPPQKHYPFGEGSYKLTYGHGWKFNDGELTIGLLWNSYGHKKDFRVYKTFGKQQIKGKIKTALIRRDACGDIWCTITTDHTEHRNLPKTGEIGGFDYSKEHFYISDDGRRWDIPLILEDRLKELSHLRRKIDKSKKGSNNRLRLRKKLARKYRAITRQKEAIFYNLAYKWCSEYDVICIEDNDFADMRKKGRIVNGHRVTRKERRKLVAHSPATFIRILKEVAKKTGKTIWQANRFFASSQICSECGYVNSKLKNLRIRHWKCPKCGKVHDRDVNAAKNLKKEYMRTVGGAPSIATKTNVIPERETFWERIRKTSARKRDAGLGEQTPRPRNHVSKVGNDQKRVTECPELYTDATVRTAGGSDNPEVKKGATNTSATAPP